MWMPHGTRPPIRNENGDHGTARFVDPFWTWTCLAFARNTTVQPQTCLQDIVGMFRGSLVPDAGVDSERIAISLFYAALHRFGLTLTPKRPAIDKPFWSID